MTTPNTPAAAPGVVDAPYAWLRERDVDLLLCSEIHHDGELRAMLASSCGADGMTFGCAKVSHTDGDGEHRGESDLHVEWRGSAGRVVALIENKIAAAYQPEQAARYHGRVTALRTLEDVTSACSILVAPQSYMTRPGGEAFDLRISYEEIARILASSSDARSRFLATTLQAAIQQGQQRLPPHQATMRFWEICRQIAEQVAPLLHMHDNGAVSRNEGWHYFRQAEGVSTRATGIEIVYKPSNGAVRKLQEGRADVHVPRTDADLLRERLGPLLDDDMTIVQAARSSRQVKSGRMSSAMIRIPVPFLRADAAEPPEVEDIRAGLKACERLRRFTVDNLDAIMPNDRRPKS